MASQAQSPKRGDVVAAHSVHEFVFSVPDLDQAKRFYESFGLEVRQEQGCLGLYTYGHQHRWARIFEGDKKRLLWLSWGIYAEDLASFSDRLSGLGIERINAPEHAERSGIWFRGPDGLPHQLVVADKCAPESKTVRIMPPDHSNCGRAPQRSHITQVRPHRLSHILLFVPDVDEGLAFYSNVLGLRLSDRSGSIIAFMHTPHGSDHHLIAMAKSHRYGLHHSSWDVSSIDDVGSGSQQMAAAGYGEGWGLGRHVLGSNYFRYVRDPWGSYAEYSYDIDYIAANQEWPAGDYPAEDALYVWGPAPPADFTTNYEDEPETLWHEAVDHHASHATQA
jgi:catechol 2,3-dioxygenase-like lactoylglutathione lyase family enzyme